MTAPEAALGAVFANFLPERLAAIVLPQGLVAGEMLFVARGKPTLAWRLFAAEGGGPGARFVPCAADAAHVCRLTMAAADYIAFAHDDLNLQLAFMQGRLKLAGDPAQAMRLAALFG